MQARCAVVPRLVCGLLFVFGLRSSKRLCTGGAFNLAMTTYHQLRPTDCGYSARGTPLRPFLLRDAPGASHALWRCAPCTRYKVQAVAAGQGLFGCTLANGAPLSQLFTEATLAESFPFLYNADALRAHTTLMHGFAVVEPLVFPQNESTVLQVLAGLEELGALGTLAFWGGPRHASDPMCAQRLHMHECGAFSGGYDPTRALQQEHSILQRARANPSLPFTMTCEGQQYTSRSQDTCNPNTDKRRQVLVLQQSMIGTVR
jgi:hypothetical protein